MAAREPAGETDKGETDKYGERSIDWRDMVEVEEAAYRYVVDKTQNEDSYVSHWELEEHLRPGVSSAYENSRPPRIIGVIAEVMDALKEREDIEQDAVEGYRVLEE